MKKNFYILIIDDEKILADQTKKMIEENCKFVNRIKIVNSGEKGLDEINKEMPDYIILNQHMLGMLEKCNSLKLKLPGVIVIISGELSRMEEKRFYELGVKYISSRRLNKIQKRFIFYYIEQAYKISTKIDSQDMARILSKQLEKILRDVKNIKQPYSVSLMGYVLGYLVVNDIEYSKDVKNDLYEELRKEHHLTDMIINEIREKIEEVIEISYIQDDPIRKSNYEINKDEIQEEFFHTLKENVLKDIIAESN